MLIKESNSVPVCIFGSLKAKYFVQSWRSSPVRLEIDITPSGGYILNLYVSRIGNLVYRLLVEISESRLRLISRGEMSVDYPFLYPENEIFYAALFDDENISRLAWVSPSDLMLDNPIPSDQFALFDPEICRPTFNLLEHARSRGRIIVEVRLDSKGLKSNLRYWAVKNFLIPFSELVKTAIFDHNYRYPQVYLESNLNFGFSFIRMGSLHSVIELDYNTDLFGHNVELENLENLFRLLRAESKEEIIEHLEHFHNKKIIPDYIRVLRSVIKTGSSFESRLAIPREELAEVYFDHRRCLSIKSIVETNLPETDYDEIVTGTLTCLDFENRKRPVFSLYSSVDDKVYSGLIDPGLDGFMNSNEFRFCTKIYDCTLRILFIPESLKCPEQYRYTLMRIDEVQESAFKVTSQIMNENLN